MPFRRSAARPIASILAGGLVWAAASAHAQTIEGYPADRFVSHDERLALEAGPPITLRLMTPREVAGLLPRIRQISVAAIGTLTRWLGPLEQSELTIAGLPWTPGAAAISRTGFVAVPVRWLTPERDRTLERMVIAALARQYWLGGAGAAPGAVLEDGLALYTATRAVHDLLEGSNFATERFFGGMVPLVLRPLLLSPPVADPRPRVWRFNEFTAAPDVTRIQRALQTLERHVGWPTFQQALAAFRQKRHDRPGADGLAAALSLASGRDLRALVRECLRSEAAFDYAVDALAVTPSDGAFETAVTISRRGAGRFTAGGHEAGDPERTMPVLVRFADGREVRDWFDGAAASTTLTYTAPAPGVAAAVDPDAMLLLDTDRANNTYAPDAPVAPVGIRLALHWMAWLQNTLLAYSTWM